MNTSVARPAPLFLRPTARNYPVDEVCAKIAEALEARNWEVPGIEVKFTTYGSGASLFRMLYEVRGNDFALRYHRSQGLNDGFYDMAAINRIAILKKDVELYGDGSGPRLSEYIGDADDWEKDRKWFYRGYYSSRRENLLEFREHGPYVNVTSSYEYGSTGTATLLVAHDGSRLYKTFDLLDEFSRWLKDNVLTVIESYPESEPDHNRFNVADIPFPSGLPPIFCFATMEDAYRIRQAKVDITEIRPQNRYGLREERSLVNLGVRDKHHPHDKAFREVARWCGFGEVDETSTIWKSDQNPGLSIAKGPGGYYPSDCEFICRITPNRANNIYVADYEEYMKVRRVLIAELNDRKEFTPEEMKEMDLAFAHSIVPITEYDGSYEQPVVLVQRELEFDEVELVAGPMKEGAKKYWREQHG